MLWRLRESGFSPPKPFSSIGGTPVRALSRRRIPFSLPDESSRRGHRDRPKQPRPSIGRSNCIPTGLYRPGTRAIQPSHTSSGRAGRAPGFNPSDSDTTAAIRPSRRFALPSAVDHNQATRTHSEERNGGWFRNCPFDRAVNRSIASLRIRSRCRRSLVQPMRDSRSGWSA
jgi:hypothetical protein